MFISVCAILKCHSISHMFLQGLSEAQLDDLVWPIDTYASLVCLLFVGFLAEMVSYRVAILLGLACRQATRLLLLFSSGLLPMQLMQATYACATSVEAVYFAYPYVVVEPKHFLVATVAVRASVHLGNAVGSGLGQLLVSVWHVELRTLFFISWAFTSIGVLSFALLPCPRKHTIEQSVAPAWLRDGGSVFIDLVRVYEGQVSTGSVFNSPLALWSAWWVMGTATSQVFINYQQNLLYASDPHAPFGLVAVGMEIASTAIICLPLLQKVTEREESPSQQSTRALLHITLTSALWALVCFASLFFWGWPPPLWVSCVASVVLSAVLGLQQALASVSIASGAHAKEEEAKQPPYALVFTTASLFGLVIATLTQWLAAEAAVQTKGYMLLAALQEAFVLPLVLLLVWLAYTCSTRPTHSETLLLDPT